MTVVLGVSQSLLLSRKSVGSQFKTLGGMADVLFCPVKMSDRENDYHPPGPIYIYSATPNLMRFSLVSCTRSIVSCPLPLA